jgi:N-acetylmuramoyl-L-alanine amidase
MFINPYSRLKMNYVIFISALLMQLVLGGCSPYKQSIPAEMILPAPSAQPFQMQPQPMAQNFPKQRNHEKIVVMLDAGHGGDDFGTHSLVKPVYHEKHLNLSCTMMVKNFLQQFGYEVMLTRQDDTFVPLDQRSLFANEQKPRIFVSIHFNSAPSTDAEGIEVFYFRNESDKKRMDKSKILAQAILDKTLHNTQAKSRGVKHGNYAVIRETTMPAALIEGGFLTNEKEMEKIKNGAYLKSLALGIAQGIQDYLAKETVMK